MEHAIQLNHVTRKFGDLVAVEGLSLQVQPGEAFGLLGPNGAGKTTTINLITGLLHPDSGDIQVLGYDPQTQARQVRQRLGLVPQETNVYADLNALDNLWHHAALYCPELDLVKERIKALLNMMSLWERRKDPVRTYSGGMKRRLALARALLHNPEVILFDEPTLGVDVQGRHTLWEHIKEQQQLGKTFIVSTNNMHEADALCDRLAIIDHGKLITLDSPENLRAALGRDIVTLVTEPRIDDPQSLFAGLGVKAVTRPEPETLRLEVQEAECIAGELVARTTRQHRLESINMARPTLDDIFLHYTGRALRD
jgi:ABC-type multidrug transport system ATPase subunit